MKKLIAAAVMSIIAFGATAGILETPLGPAKVNLDAIVQATDFHQVSSKTNSSATSTNITTVLKSTTSRSSLNGDDLLALLANSFNTNFPTGSQVGMQFGGLVVVDSTGTNIIFNPFSVVNFQFDTEVESAAVTEVETLNKSGESTSGSAIETFTVVVTMNYDDTARTTHDGTHTKFSFKGVSTVQLNISKTGTEKANVVFQGSGGGTVQNVETILTGTLSVKSVGHVGPA